MQTPAPEPLGSAHGAEPGETPAATKLRGLFASDAAPDGTTATPFHLLKVGRKGRWVHGGGSRPPPGASPFPARRRGPLSAGMPVLYVGTPYGEGCAAAGDSPTT